MVTLSVSVFGDIEEHFKAVAQAQAEAGRVAIQRSSVLTRTFAAAQSAAALGVKVGRTWRRIDYTKGSNSVSPAALIYTRAPDIVDGFAMGATILPRRGRYLAIPTRFNPRVGGRSRRLLVSPQEMVASRESFVRPRKNGPGLLWMIPVRRVLARRNRRTRQLATLGGIRIATRLSLGLARQAIEAGAVPLFTLLPQVTLRRRLDLEALRRFGLETLATELQAAQERELT